MRIDDRIAVAAEAVQQRDEMLVAVDGHRVTQFVSGGDRVIAGISSRKTMPCTASPSSSNGVTCAQQQRVATMRASRSVNITQ